MVEFAVGDLYDEVASKNNGAVVNPDAFYDCKYCPMFQISGTSLRDSDTGRVHAAAHRIAFEALLEPSPVLICPICDLPQKTSEVACVFGCMFNDLDLVDHLEHEHGEVLRDEMVCDFSDPRYLFTTFRERRSAAPASSERHSDGTDETNEVDDDRTTITLSDGDMELNESDGDEVEEKYSPQDSSMESSLGEAQPSTDVRCEGAVNSGADGSITTAGAVIADPPETVDAAESNLTQGNSVAAPENECNNNEEQANVMDTDIGTSLTEKQVPDTAVTVTRRREQMEGVSYIECLICDWSPLSLHDPRKMREELSSHVRSHIREEASKLPNRTDSSFADQRLLSCMDFSLEEYFEKEHLTDLSGTINSRIMERVYSDLLSKLFGICVPVVYRILHGNNGNPFRPPEVVRKRRKAKLRSKGGKDNPRSSCTLGAVRTFKRTFSNSTETTESSDADSGFRESNDLPGIGSFESDQHIQCARAECGHSLLTPADKMAIVHHIAAHIRHDEARLLNRAGASPLVACDCGVSIGSPMGYVYHIVHDHVFERRQFSDIAATIASYLMLIVETAIESVLAVRLDFRSNKWTLWCAYFCLEDDEGDEQLFADSTDLNEHWLKLWEDLIDESMTGKSMTLGDTIKLFEMHPFVDEHRLQTRKHKSVPVMDSDKVHRSLLKIWRRLNSWASDPIDRTHLACDSRWIRLAQIRRKVLLESRKSEHGQSDVLCRISVKTSSSAFDVGKRSSRPSFSLKSPAVITSAEAETTVTTVVAEVQGSSELHNEGLTESTVCEATRSGVNENEIAGELTSEHGPSGKLLQCNICANVYVSTVNTALIKDHCALHAAMEGRMLCALYIHRAADRPQTCPFCCMEMNVYKPAEFLEHVKMKHMEKARIIYDRYLHQYFPQSKIFSGPVPPADSNPASRDYFAIRCERSTCCGVDPVLALPREKAIQLADVDITVVKHILWHVRNDSFLDLDAAERDLLTRALMIRLSCAQMRQVLFMARRVNKQFYRCNEPDVVKYIQAKMDEIGCVLFGVNKGLVYQMVFTRRFVRDQSGMLIYPPCVCRLCVDKELPRYSVRGLSDRRKRTFVAYAHPVVLHILEHLNARQLPEKLTSMADDMRWKSACRMDGLRFKSVSAAIKHVLDAHNDLVELSALDMVLEDMGLFQIFRDAMSIVLGEQSWQLEEALGFGAYKMKPCSKPQFLNDLTSGVAHRADCTRQWDPSAPLCTCESVSVQDEQASSAEPSTQYRGYRLRTTSLRDMPEASAACYEEFLHGVEAQEGVELPSPNDVVANAEECAEQAVTTQPPPSPNAENVTETVAMPLISVKTELAEERSDFDNHPVNSIGGVSLPATLPPLDFTQRNDDRAKSVRRRRPSSKKVKQKRCSEIKREIDGVVLPQRNKALPLKACFQILLKKMISNHFFEKICIFKNVIQGSKTVAAALVAALGSPTKGACSLPGSSHSSHLQGDGRGAQGEALDGECSSTHEGTSTSSSSSKANVNNVTTRGEKNSQTVPGVAVKKPRLAVASSDNATEATQDSTSDTQPKRRLRASSGRRKSALSDTSSSKT
ncbi:hypothetical protein ANCCAN_06993 [Ancylostoma caninum]|uniref:Uncharacterized protein n=1 Tax=Ancylostoma caninum TaxID=29170 RepID=A0A368GRH2_ANCCA|nr:hypothetical protein ANCCAN_06993 [Ancylostoma caninum]